MIVRRTILFSGRVQGVGFRFTACRIAESYKVTGYVRNLDDGRLEMVAEGDVNELDTFVEAVRNAMKENIRQLAVAESPATSQFARFDVSH